MKIKKIKLSQKVKRWENIYMENIRNKMKKNAHV